MSGIYRESPASSIQCPRCGAETPPGDIVACINGCGMWVDHETAATAFEPGELRQSRIASWFRELCSCPLCGTQMTLWGHDMSLFQGCDGHGFWVDDSTISQTGLGRSVVAPQLAHARAQVRAVLEERRRAEAAAREAAELSAHDAAARAEQQRIEQLAQRLAEARGLKAREDAARPYFELLRRATHDPLPLAEKLRELEDRIARLEGTQRERDQSS